MCPMCAHRFRSDESPDRRSPLRHSERLPPTAPDNDRGTTLLGPWYATVLFWRPRIVLLVNEVTLLPVLLPLAPARTLTGRLAEQIGTVLTTLDAPSAIVNQERRHMRTAQLGVTNNRSVVGVMTDFARLAEIHHDDDPTVDLVALAVRLAATPAARCTAGTSVRTVNSPPRCRQSRPDTEHETGHVHRYATEHTVQSAGDEAADSRQAHRA